MYNNNMADDIIDLLQIKIEKAKSNLSDDTLNAIAAVSWKDTITQMRERDGFTFEQLEDLELETELLLCGLLSPTDYPKELEKRMGISKAAANSLTEEMNKLVFEKIKEELIKNTERKRMFEKKQPHPSPLLEEERENTHDTEEQKIKNTEILKNHGIEIIGNPPLLSEEGIRGGNSKETLPIPEKLELKGNTVHPMLAQKISTSVQAPIVKTEHTLQNLSSTTKDVPVKNTTPKIDPYREIPE
jgi:hypothetical protein